MSHCMTSSSCCRSSININGISKNIEGKSSGLFWEDAVAVLAEHEQVDGKARSLPIYYLIYM